jgi:hypothetical protein
VSTFRSFGDAAKPYGNLAKSLAGKGLTPLQNKVGRRMQRLAEAAASADLGGNDSFSGWRRGNPIPLDTTFQPLKDGKGIVFHPTKRGAGPWTVAEFGRGGGFQGPGVSASTGLTRRGKRGNVLRPRKFKKYSGTTAGKDTASDAIATFDQVVPNLIRQGVLEVIDEHLG